MQSRRRPQAVSSPPPRHTGCYKHSPCKTVLYGRDGVGWEGWLGCPALRRSRRRSGAGPSACSGMCSRSAQSQTHCTLRWGTPPPGTCHPLSFYLAAKRSECGWFGARKHLFDEMIFFYESYPGLTPHHPGSPWFSGSGWHFASPRLVIPHPKLGPSTRHSCASASRAPMGVGRWWGCFGGKRPRCTRFSIVSVVRGAAVDIALPCFQGVTGWGHDVKSESRPPQNNDFIYCMSICDSS